MYYGRSQTRGWNIFARELQNVLRRHNLDLSMLDDRVGIHPEKVRRLVQSLQSPKSFPVLNVEEMDQLAAALNLSEDELIHLRAALLAASIERTLMDRINQDDALLATNQIFPTILQALQDEADGDAGLGNTRGGPDTGAEGDSEIDETFRSAYDALDAGEATLSLILHMPYMQMSLTKKLSQLHLAITYFTEALKALNETPGNMQRLPAWRASQQRAQAGLRSAQEQLAKP